LDENLKRLYQRSAVRTSLEETWSCAVHRDEHESDSLSSALQSATCAGGFAMHAVSQLASETQGFADWNKQIRGKTIPTRAVCFHLQQLA